MIECVPNVSEGRRADVVERMAVELRASGVDLLDVSSDWSHNRTVFTLVGAAPELTRAILALFARALAEIDLRAHHGEHPRMGAVDVVPFVPLGSTPMVECVTLARAVGRLVGDRFGVPVFLYEEAATAPARRRLEHIRRGGFEGLAAKLRDPAWQPDFGPDAPHPSAGASAIGARRPLIAFNVNLASDRLDIAKAIAAVIRESGGGLPGVKALGVRLADRGLVQVTTNVTDFRVTGLAAVFAAIEREAAARGAGIVESEIVGLVPEAALAGLTPADLKLAGFTGERILEHRIRRGG